MSKIRLAQLADIIVNPFRSLYVDASTTVATASQNGSLYSPFKTIQQGLNAIPAATTAAEMRQGPWQLHVASGTYDEDLSFSITAKQLIIFAHGAVNLGTFDAAAWQPSGTRRNLTLTGVGTADAALGTLAPTLSILSDRPVLSLNLPAGFRISGKIDFSAVTSTGSWFQSYQYIQVFGTTGTAAGDAVIGPAAFGAANLAALNIVGSVFNARITGNISIVANPITVLSGSNFLGAISIRRMGGGFANAYSANVTCDVALSSTTGFLGCVFAAGTTWTITAGGAFQVDDSTYSTVRSNAVALGAATTWSLVSSAANYRLKLGGVLVLANDLLAVNGLALSTALVAQNPSSQAVIDQNVLLTKLSWNTTAGTAATQIRIYKNGAVFFTTLLTGGVKAVLAVSLSFAAGDLVSVDYSGVGPAPGAMTLDLST